MMNLILNAELFFYLITMIAITIISVLDPLSVKIGKKREKNRSKSTMVLFKNCIGPSFQHLNSTSMIYAFNFSYSFELANQLSKVSSQFLHTSLYLIIKVI